MALFCAAIRNDSVSLFTFPFLRPDQVFLYEISLVCHLKYPYCFSSHFLFSCYCYAVDPCVIWVVSGRCNYPFFVFLCSLRVVLSMNRCYLQCWRFFLLLFLTHTTCQSSLGCKALWIVISFLVLWFICWSSSPSTLRMVSSIFEGGQPSCLSLWWGFCYIVWFQVVFSFS